MGRFSKSKSGGSTVADYLPYEDLYEDGLILTKDWGLMKVWSVTYPDASLSDDIADEISERIARLFHGHPESIKETRVTYWFVTGRIPVTLKVNPARSGLVNMTGFDYDIEKYRDGIFADAAKNDVNICYACCKVQVKVEPGKGINPESRRKAESLYTSFETALNTIGARALPLVCGSDDEDRNIMVFLKYMTGVEYANFRCPPQGMRGISRFLSANFITTGQPMKIGNYYVQMLTINAFPGATYPDILIGLEQLPFCFKWVTRWTPMSNWDSQEAAKNLRKDYRAGAKSFKTAAYEASTGQDSGNYEFQALTDIQEMEEVLVDLTKGETMGEMTSVIMLYSLDPQMLPRMVQDVRKKIKALFVWMAEVKEELSKPQTPSLADLLIAYYNQRNAGAWSNKARTGNLKQFAEAVNYLTENKLLTLEDLQERLSSVSEEFEALSGSMKKKSARIKELQELIREGENYQRLKPVHTELNNIKFKKQREKFETSHDAELRLFYAARRILKEKLDGKPIALKAWKQEYAQLKTEYAELSPQHKPLREEVIRLRQVQNAVDTALRRREQPQAVQRKKHEMER